MGRWTTGVTLVAVCVAWVVSPSWAQTGASDNRVSLPDGPGSMEGLGDDVAMSGNMGMLTWQIAMPTPTGFAGVSPDLALHYSSASGPGIAGVGWDLPTTSIERLTLRGVPDYDLDDEFVADTGQLVYVGGTNPREYRSRFEGSFVRYRWYDAAVGAGGYWTAEYPDGRVGWFGAAADADAVASARVGGDDGVFRYLLVDVVDVHGHRLHHQYDATESTSLLRSMQWVESDGSPMHEVRFGYQGRPDVLIDASGGFVERLEHRLGDVEVSTRGTVTDRWELSYESESSSGGLSRLAGVVRTGIDGETWPVQQSFSWSTGLDAGCLDACDRPRLWSLGNVGVDLSTGDPRLVDMNGDALPDLVDSTLAGAPHRIFINTMDASGRQRFAAPVDSALGAQDAFDFSSSRVQVLDVDGDGFTDAANLLTGTVLFNDGAGDWSTLARVGADALPDLESPGMLATVRFVDIDNDRRIDVLRASGTGASHTTQIYRNTGAGFVPLDDAVPLGRGFDSGTLEVNDVNGDGLVDVAEVATTGVRYRLNLGHGRWWPQDEWAFAALDGDRLTASQTGPAELEDINGDGFADLVLVEGTRVRVWINRAGERLEALAPITEADVEAFEGASMPARSARTTVLMADVNANGSSDIVWVTSGGDATALDLFPVRPNLLSTIDNGLGVRVHVTYGTSVAERIRDEDTSDVWTRPLPFASVVVKAIETQDGTSGVGWRTEYAYHGGFYDGIEKQFRGYERVVVTEVGDEAQEGTRTTETFDVGVEDPYGAGRRFSTVITTVAGEPMLREAVTWADCDVDVDSTGLRWPIRHRCTVANTITVQERADASAWREIRTEQAWDAWGNVISESRLGVVSVGGAPTCAACPDEADGYPGPCGEGCRGDESYVDTTYIEPGEATAGRWILGAVQRRTTWGDAARTDLGSDEQYFYDGDAFEGLPAGQLSRGMLTRTTARVDAEAEVDVMRVQRDAHGNVVTSASANWRPGAAGESTRTVFDAEGLHPVANEIVVDDVTTLRSETVYDELRRLPVESTGWFRTDTSDPRVVTLVGYDAFGRPTSRVLPGGDTFVEPSMRFDYEVTDAGQRVRTFARRRAGEAYDRELVSCLDGYGRLVQQRVRTSDGRYLVVGSTVFGRRGLPIRMIAEYMSDTDSCGADAPPSAEVTTITYDALGRSTGSTITASDGSTRAAATEYLPDGLVQYDANDLDASHPHFDTPIVRQLDGLGRPVAIGRTLASGASPDWWRVTWDASSNLRAMIDPLGNVRTQQHDLLGRVVVADDPDRGVQTWTYDARGNVIAASDPTGTVRYAFDGAGRRIERWVDGDREATLSTTVWDAAADCPGQQCTFAANRPVATHFETPAGGMSEWLGYDPHGRTIWTARDVRFTAGEEPRRLERRWRIDQLGGLEAAFYPGGYEVAYRWDPAGRLVSIPGYVDGVALDDRGLVADVAFDNGVTVGFGRDAFRRLNRLVVRDPAGVAAADLGWAYDANDRVTEAMDALATGDAPSGTARYTYDGFDRLTSVDYDPGTAVEETVTWTYDAIDNLLARTSSMGTASPVHDGNRTLDVNRPHAVSRIGETQIAWDAAGRVVRRGEIETVWSGFGDLAAHVADDGARVDYGYASGDRVVAAGNDGRLTVFFGPDCVIDDGVVSVMPQLGAWAAGRHEYLVDDDELYDDIAPLGAVDGRITAADAWIASAMAHGFIDASTERPITSETAIRTLTSAAARGRIGWGDRRTWHHRDALGTLVAVTNEDGDVIERPLHYPFGTRRGESLRPGAEPNDFSGLRRTDWGTVHFDLRDYDPWMGRWLAPDRVFETVESTDLTRPWEAFGAYSYVANQPTNAIDPTGGTMEEAVRIPLATWLIDNVTGSTRTNAIKDHRIASIAADATMWAAAETAMDVLGRMAGYTAPPSAGTGAERLAAFIKANEARLKADRTVYQATNEWAAYRAHEMVASEDVGTRGNGVVGRWLSRMETNAGPGGALRTEITLTALAYGRDHTASLLQNSTSASPSALRTNPRLYARTLQGAYRLLRDRHRNAHNREHTAQNGNAISTVPSRSNIPSVTRAPGRR